MTTDEVCFVCGTPGRGQPCAECELEALRAWKAEATQVLEGWDRVAKALRVDEVGRVGEVASEVALAEVERLRGINSDLAAGLATWQAREAKATAEAERLRRDFARLEAEVLRLETEVLRLRSEDGRLRAEVEGLRIDLELE